MGSCHKNPKIQICLNFHKEALVWSARKFCPNAVRAIAECGEAFVSPKCESCRIHKQRSSG